MPLSAAFSRPLLWRSLVILTWLVLLAVLFSRDFFIRAVDLREEQIVARGRQESYMGVYLKKQRIGYVMTRIQADEDVVEVTQEGILHLQILGENHPIRMAGTAKLSPSFPLESFAFSLTSPFYSMQSHGRVNGTTIDFSMDSGKGLITDRISLERPPYFAMNQRGHLLKLNLEKGEKIRLPSFDPLTLSGKESIITYQGREKILIKRVVYDLHHFQELVSGIRVNFWLDDSGKVIKEESAAGFVFLAEPKFKAMDIEDSGDDLLASVAVDYQGRLPNLTTSAAVRYRLGLPEEGIFDLDGGRQEFAGTIVTVRNEEKTDLGSCGAEAKDLAATTYVQSEAPAITSLAAEIIGSHQEPLAKILALTAWVYDNLDKRPVIGLPDALTTLASRQGDCNEHAVLFAALARAVHLPTRIAAGVMLHEGRFYYHAWNEVCTPQGWLSVDSSRNQLPADLSHIRFVIGETSEQLRIGSLLGNLEITVLDDLPK
ncbi:MAG: transglutaminase domain-containing protein [Proteobacteria bacterium]|nr:transglutaminase domain-containing protein [Pseudomonadota bacterium]MBU1639187.1 transglutaminase domain-containing protein [Pseudomonadota bacterium]